MYSRKTISHILLIFINILTSVVFSKDISKNHKISFLTNNDGLVNNAINCIYEDQNKNIWIGTWDGLSIYNGRDFKNLRYNADNDGSISSNVVRNIVEDSNGDLWVATDFGINRINPTSLNIERYYLNNEAKQVKQENEFHVMIDEDVIYAYSAQTGLYKWEYDINQFLPFDSTLISLKRLEICNGSLYFIDQSGKFSIYSIENNLNKKQFENINQIKNSSSFDNFFLVDKYIVLISPYDYSIYNIETLESHEYKKGKEDIIINVLIKEDIIYLFFKNGNIQQLDITNKTLKTIQYNYSDVSLFTSYFGSQDILWLGTDGKGIIKIYENKTNFNTTDTKYPVRDFEEYGKYIIVATKGGGIGFYDKNKKNFRHYITKEDGLIDNSVYSLKKNNIGDIFIGTDGYGLNILRKNGKLETLELPTGYTHFKSIYSIINDEKTNTLWLGTSGNGLVKIEYTIYKNRYYAKSTKSYQSNLPNSTIYALMFDSLNNNIWIGTRGAGLFYLDLNSNSINPIYKNILHEDILCLSEKDNLLWVGTSYGLEVIPQYDKNKQDSKQFEPLIPSNAIHGILQDSNHNNWVSTNNGLFKIYKNNEKTEHFTHRSGLQNNEFSDGAYFKDSDGELFFGGVSGFNHFKAEDILLSDYKPQIILSDLRLFNNSININGKIFNQTLDLSHDQKFVTLDFLSKDLIDTKNCKYRYRFKELSTDWIDNGLNSIISISNFPAGKYNLEVQATNSDGIWNDMTYHLRINIHPPFWLSDYALVTYIILLLGLAYLTYRIINNRIKLNRTLLLNKIEQKHEKQIHESRLNFFTNIAHEFFTPLTLIFTPAQYLLENTRLDLESKRYIQLIKNNASRMQRLINELMEFRKVETENIPLKFEEIHLKNFIDPILHSFDEFKVENNIDLQCKISNDATIISDKNSLEKIIYNVLSNAFKYTPIFGYICLTIDVLDKCAYIDIKNSGRGLSQEKIDKIFLQFKVFDNETEFGISKPTGIGLSYTKSLVELLGGKVAITSEINKYVNVAISIPSKELNYNQTENQQQSILQEPLIASNKHERILIVEDNIEIQNLIVNILDNHYEILKAKDGQEALNILADNTVNLIITDIMMGYYDGIDLIKKIRVSDLFKHIPIIVISAKTSSEDQVNTLELGADHYITKPFNPQYLKIIIKNILSKQDDLKAYYRSSTSSIITRDGNMTHVENDKELKQIISTIEKYLESDKLDALEIASLLGISKATLYRKTKELLNETPNGLIKKIRLRTAANLLITTTLTVEAIRLKVGFQNKSYFYREFYKEYKMKPLEYRENSNAISKQ